MSEEAPKPRRNMTEELVISSQAPDRSWDEMAEFGRAVANYELWLVGLAMAKAKKDFAPLPEEIWERYREAMAVIKQNRVEERQANGGNAPTDLSDVPASKLMKARR